MQQELTHWKKLINPAYIGAYSLQPGEEKIVEIESVGREKVKGPDGKEDTCTVAKLKNEKPFILNSTNCKTLTKVFGTPYIEQWQGKKVIIYAEKIKAFGDFVEALRIRPTAPMLPELNEKSAKWLGVVKAIQENRIDIVGVEKVFNLTPANKALLTDLANTPA